VRAFYDRLIEAYVGLGLVAKIGLGVGLVVLSTLAALAIVVYLPADHFKHSARDEGWRRQHPVGRWVLRIGKNTMGLAVFPLALFMLIGPGPGVVVLLISLSLVDFPGKRSIERRLLGRPRVIRFLNDLRAQFRKPPLALDPD
jgi:hypothetical protein